MDYSFELMRRFQDNIVIIWENGFRAGEFVIESNGNIRDMTFINEKGHNKAHVEASFHRALVRSWVKREVN